MKDAVTVLEELTSLYPSPINIRSDSVPEFIAYPLKRWCRRSGTATAHN